MHDPAARGPQLKQDTGWIALTKTWRTSGLLHDIAAEDLKTLLWVLSFTTAQGDCQPSVPQVAHAMNVSEAKARRRLERLTRFLWQGQPLLTAMRRGNGSDAYTPTERTLFLQPPAEPADALKQSDPFASDTSPGTSQAVGLESPPTPVIGDTPAPDQRTMTRKEEIISASRRKYGRPRAEVERLIAEQMGWQQIPSPVPLPAGSQPSTGRENGQGAEQSKLRQQLVAVGIDAEGIEWLLSTFEVERIQRQLEWLPHRRVRNPPGFLMAAIEHDYEAPFALRQRESHHHERDREERR